ncbi:MAG: hypothetical protein FWH20_08140 [Oscillospiraceae bacterium]|nr:hypothetical protein [Oscillospiraceae bacterium]
MKISRAHKSTAPKKSTQAKGSRVKIIKKGVSRAAISLRIMRVWAARY